MNTELSGQEIHDKQVASWLLIVAAVIFLMIILGGATRLTNSGLSMVDWNPIMGAIPPLSETEWTQTFERYKEFPQYQKINKGMSLGEFKTIFYYEYLHRLLGRLIGLIFLLPFLFLWFRGAIRRTMLPQMVALFVLGGMQGLLGWYMVKSGLINEPQVSQYRLTAHLITAVAIFGYLLWVAFGLLKKTSTKLVEDSVNKIYGYSKVMIGLVVFMITSGGFVAGTKAGYAYSTFPLMAGKFIPDGLYTLQPFWLNWFENITTVQFNHRIFAYILILIIPLFCFAVRRIAQTRPAQIAAHLLLAMLVIQVTLGVATLVMHMPVAIAVSHQGGAMILLALVIFISRELKPEVT